MSIHRHSKKSLYTDLHQSHPRPQRCLICFATLSTIHTLTDLFNPEDVLCRNCRRQLIAKPVIIDIGDFRVRSLYPYTDFFQKLLIQYKDLFDEALAPVFLYPYVKKLNKAFKERNLVSIPSHLDHIAQRGFDHVPLLFERLDVSFLPLLKKVSNRHQARTNVQHRQDNLFERVAGTFTNLILVDDMCTTAASLKQAVSLLSSDCEIHECFTVGYHPLLLKQYRHRRWKM